MMKTQELRDALKKLPACMKWGATKEEKKALAEIDRILAQHQAK